MYKYEIEFTSYMGKTGTYIVYADSAYEAKMKFERDYPLSDAHSLTRVD